MLLIEQIIEKQGGKKTDHYAKIAASIGTNTARVVRFIKDKQNPPLEFAIKICSYVNENFKMDLSIAELFEEAK